MPPAPLLEGPETQSLIERIADRFIWAACHKGATLLREKRAQDVWNDLGPEDMGGVGVDEAFPRLIKRHWSPAGQVFLLWMKHHKLRMHFVSDLEVLGMRSSASYRGPSHYGQPEVAVKIPEAEFERIDDADPITPTVIQEVLQKHRRSIIHEFTHAYDDCQSTGKYKANKQSAASLDARLDAYWSKNPEEWQKANTLYLNDPVEVNARYTETVARLEASRLQTSWRTYLQTFMWEFRGWKDLPPETQRRLKVRLAAQWQAGRDTAPQPDYKDAVARLQKRVREITGAKDLWLTYNMNGRKSPVVTIERFGTKDPRMIDAILKATSRVADVLGMTVTTAEVKHGPATIAQDRKSVV